MAIYNARNIADRSTVIFWMGNLFQSGERLDIRGIPAFISERTDSSTYEDNDKVIILYAIARAVSGTVKVFASWKSV
jgi:hypothetical protein